LRDATALSVSGDTLDLTQLTCSKITLTTGGIKFNGSRTLLGPGADKLTIDGAGRADDVLAMAPGTSLLRVDSLHIANGKFRGIFSFDGVSLNRASITGCDLGVAAGGDLTLAYSSISSNFEGVVGSNVTIANSTISGNSGYACAGIHVGSATISNTTISGNSAIGGYYFPEGYGAGCIDGPATITNSTIASNTSSPGRVGGLRIGAQPTIESSIFANNGWDLSASFSHTIVSGHNNLINNPASNATVPADTITADPKLLPLADNGGPTFTHALSPGSLAIDAGSNSAGLTTDQRGSPFVRSAGARPDIGAFESQPAPPGNIDADFTGAWFDPAQSGHGLFVEVLPGHNLLAYWFTFNPAGTQQAWFMGVGTYSGDIATITQVDQPSGGRWIPNFNPNTIAHNLWGTLTFTFTDHDHGKVDFNSVRGYGAGSMNLTRLTHVATQTTTPAAGIGAGFTGSWYDPAQSGHGLVLEVLPDKNLLAYWFTYNPAGDQQAWFGGVGTYSGNTASITSVEQPMGGRWIPNFNPAAIVRNPWGKLTFDFSDCNHGRVDFVSTVSGYGSNHMDLTRLTQPAGLTCP
jgi:hypothetical protein